MPIPFRPALAIACLLLTAPAAAAERAAAPACAAEALAQAEKLLAFHVDGDDRAAIEPEAKTLPPLANPAAPGQRLSVVEVWGNVYRGRYRMRFLYAGEGATACTLLGQEILEYAQL
ncbi:hypothetical protein LDO32_17175 [Luteimonas sp. Y-2-2-4F]|nr:hypothetical protein [Luteimonas sp. Y-2-2-4F]MCD9033448.1 hypothetical protein [Luteimonas sp. Y-2-2-4F]